ncbi:MAG: hypothetical protein ACTSUG_10770 [Candidatus Helarchaeota archaeon]
MEIHKNIILKYKKTLKDIFKTKFFQYLKECYIPKVLQPITDNNGKIIEDENGNIEVKAVILQSNLPDIESMSYALSLLRQFILKKDDISIYKIGAHIRVLGTSEQYKRFEQTFKEFKEYISSLSGAEYANIDKDGKIKKLKKFTRKELLDELFYGNIFHRQEDKFDVDDILAINKIVEYFLGFLVYICRIATIIMFPEEDKTYYYENCPSRILTGNN